MLICITGIDGCGKSTQIKLLEAFFRTSGKTVFISKAYGPTEKEVFAPFVESWPPVAIMFLFQALHSKQKHLAVKALEKGEIVIADRWDESYLAYHSRYGFLASEPVLRRRLNDAAFSGIKPDLTFLLDVPVSEALQRITIAREADFFDCLPAEYHASMRQAYLDLAQERHWIILDGTLPPDLIHQRIVRHISDFLIKEKA